MSILIPSPNCALNLFPFRPHGCFGQGKDPCTGNELRTCVRATDEINKKEATYKVEEPYRNSATRHCGLLSGSPVNQLAEEPDVQAFLMREVKVQGGGVCRLDPKVNTNRDLQSGIR